MRNKFLQLSHSGIDVWYIFLLASLCLSYEDNCWNPWPKRMWHADTSSKTKPQVVYQGHWISTGLSKSHKLNCMFCAGKSGQQRHTNNVIVPPPGQYTGNNSINCEWTRQMAAWYMWVVCLWLKGNLASIPVILITCKMFVSNMHSRKQTLLTSCNTRDGDPWGNSILNKRSAMLKTSLCATTFESSTGTLFTAVGFPLLRFTRTTLHTKITTVWNTNWQHSLLPRARSNN